MSATVPVGAGAPQAATLRVTSEYLSRDNMHFRPLSARVFHLINYSANELFYTANERPALAIPLKALAYATSYAGMTLNCIVALVEGLATGVIASIATIAHLSTGAQSEFLQKYTLKCWSYSFNCSSVLLTQLFFLTRGLATKYHLADAVLLNSQSFISTAATHFIFCNIFNTIAGRELSQAYTGNLQNDTFAIAFEDLLRAARNDRLMGGDRAGGANNDFLARFPQHRETVERLFNRRAGNPVITGQEINNNEFQHLFRDFLTIPQFQDVLREYLQYLGLDGAAAAAAARLGAPGAADPQNAPGIIPLGNNFNGTERAYQQKLERLVKEVTTEVYRNPDLVRLFCEDAAAQDPVQEGRDAMGAFDVQIITPLANYAVLRELEGDITCPQRFPEGGPLFQYNGRHEALTEAKRNLMALSVSEKTLLIRKLLNSSENIEGVPPDRIPAILQVYRQIGTLSGVLYQGALMRQLVLDINNLGQLENTEDLFAKAIVEAVTAESAAARG